MIELPESPWPLGVSVELIDYGYFLRPNTGAEVLRVDRAGSRYRASFSYEPMEPETARRFIARVQKGKREGLRLTYPLLGLSQGAPGNPVVDGANPTGTSLPVRGLTPGYLAKEGYALTLIDADGRGYLHFVDAATAAAADGTATFTLTIPIRASLADGSTILLAKPTIEGILVESVGWSLSVDRLVRGSALMIEEAS